MLDAYAPNFTVTRTRNNMNMQTDGDVSSLKNKRQSLACLQSPGLIRGQTPDNWNV